MALGSRQTSLRRELKSVADGSSLLTRGKSGVTKPLRLRSLWKHRLPTYNGRYLTRKQTS